jgi:hypothetical protein
MRPRRLAAAALGLLAVAGALAGCDDDGADRRGTAPLDAALLCTTVQAWSDATVEVANEFRIASRELDPAARRVRYRESFDEQMDVHDHLVEALAALHLPAPTAAALDGALERVAVIIDDGAAEADGLPDAAYELRGIRDGSLVTGIEKSKAIVFAALSGLADDPATGVPRGCGRRDALDISPMVTFPP